MLANDALRRQAPRAVDTNHESVIRIGDRVVHLQVPGVFVVSGRRGRLLTVESDRGLRMTVHEVAVRRLDGPPPAPKDT